MTPQMWSSFRAELLKVGTFPPELISPDAWQHAAHGLSMLSADDVKHLGGNALEVLASKNAITGGYRALTQKGPLSFVSDRMSAGVARGALNEMAEGRRVMPAWTQKSMHVAAPKEVKAYQAVHAAGPHLIGGNQQDFEAAGLSPEIAHHLANPDHIQHTWNSILRGFTGPLHEAPDRFLEGAAQLPKALPELVGKVPSTVRHVGAETQKLIPAAQAPEQARALSRFRG